VPSAALWWGKILTSRETSCSEFGGEMGRMGGERGEGERGEVKGRRWEREGVMEGRMKGRKVQTMLDQ